MATLRHPSLILVSGPPGAGKSTLSRPLARRLGAAILDKDCVDEPFSPGDRGPRYTREVEPRVLQALLNLAEINLTNGLSVLLDVPWTHILLNSPNWVSRIRALAEKTHAPLHVVELRLSEETLRLRLRKRGLDRDQVKLATPEGWQAFRSSDRLGELNPLPHFAIDAELSPEEVLAETLRRLHESDPP